MYSEIKTNRNRLKIKKTDLELIIRYSRIQYPIEACGILVGKKTFDQNEVVEVHFVRNVLSSTVSYKMNPEAQLNVFLEAETKGLEVLGFFHSHTSGDQFWSELDEKGSRFWVGYNFFIVKVELNTWKCFRITSKGKMEIELQIV